MKIVSITHGQGVTKNTGNYESLRVYNEVEATLDAGEKVAEVHAKLRKAVEVLNEKDFEELLG